MVVLPNPDIYVTALREASATPADDPNKTPSWILAFRDTAKSSSRNFQTLERANPLPRSQQAQASVNHNNKL